MVHELPSNLSRRNFLYGLGASLGSLALTSLLQAEDKLPAASAELAPMASPLSPKPPMHPAKAKNVIMLFMEGGPGHMDTFDPKPELTTDAQDGIEIDRGLDNGIQVLRWQPVQVSQGRPNRTSTCATNGNTWPIRRSRTNSATFVAATAESLNHPEALFHMNTGSRLGGDPARRFLGDVWTGQRKPKLARLRRDDRTGLAAGRIDELDQRLPAGSLPRNSTASRRQSDSGLEIAVVQKP